MLANGLVFKALESGQSHTLRARCVINATGAFCDALRKLDDPAAAPIIAPSQGIHVVLDRSFLPGETAIIVPRTSDGRVLFAIPWHDRTLIGTTDTPIKEASLEPIALAQEIEFLLNTASQCLAKRPSRDDILTVFAGIRPLVKASGAKRTASLSRDHTIVVSKSGMLSIAGGKWTTYRKMAEDCVNHAASIGKLKKSACITKTLRVHGFETPCGAGFQPAQAGSPHHHNCYGTDAAAIRSMIDATPELGRRLIDALPICAAQVIWAARHEMARTVDDVLSRRTRALLLDAKAAVAMAPEAAMLLARELGRDERWQSDQVAQFTAMAKLYQAP